MKNEKWIIPTALTLGAIMLCLAVWGAFASVDRLFPMADPIQCPAAEEVVSVSLSEEEGASAMLEGEDIPALLEKLQDVQPTRQMSVNDFPAVREYFTIEFTTKQRMYHYFVYTENGYVYVEHPYNGIYKADEALPAWLDRLLQERIGA